MGQDRPSQSFKIFEVSQEKLGFTQFSPILPDFSQFPPTFPIFFRLKMPGKIQENSGLGIPTRPKIQDWSGCPTRSRYRFVKKLGWPSRSRPDPIFVEILSPSRYLAHSCTTRNQIKKSFNKRHFCCFREVQPSQDATTPTCARRARRHC